MDSLYYSFLRWYNGLSLNTADLFAVLTLIVASVALFMALAAFRRAVFPKYAGKIKSIQRRVDSQEERINTEVNLFDTEKHRLKTEYRELKEQYNYLEAKVKEISKKLDVEYVDFADSAAYSSVRESIKEEFKLRLILIKTLRTKMEIREIQLRSKMY